MEKISKLQLMLITTALSLICSFGVQAYIFKHEDSKDLVKTINAKPDKEYVDQQDNAIKDALKTHAKESAQRDELSQKWMQSIDAKLNILITKK